MLSGYLGGEGHGRAPFDTAVSIKPEFNEYLDIPDAIVQTIDPRTAFNPGREHHLGQVGPAAAWHNRFTRPEMETVWGGIMSGGTGGWGTSGRLGGDCRAEGWSGDCRAEGWSGDLERRLERRLQGMNAPGGPWLDS
jgi:hypothetical protein